VGISAEFAVCSAQWRRKGTVSLASGLVKGGSEALVGRLQPRFRVTAHTSYFRSCPSVWQISCFKKIMLNWAPVAHACNPSYSGGRDQEDQGLKPALGK
jgi:hypothetical protein